MYAVVRLFHTGGWGRCFALLWCCLVLLQLGRSGLLLDFQNVSVRLFEPLTSTSKLAKLVSKFSVRKRVVESRAVCLRYDHYQYHRTYTWAQLHWRGGEWLLVFTWFILRDQRVSKKREAHRVHRKWANVRYLCRVYCNSRSKNKVDVALRSKACFWVLHLLGNRDMTANEKSQFYFTCNIGTLNTDIQMSVMHQRWGSWGQRANLRRVSEQRGGSEEWVGDHSAKITAGQ